MGEGVTKLENNGKREMEKDKVKGIEGER